jgi:hypothetical protein
MQRQPLPKEDAGNHERQQPKAALWESERLEIEEALGNGNKIPHW